MKLSVTTSDDMSTAIRYIADMIDEGYTSGSIGDVVWDLKE